MTNNVGAYLYQSPEYLLYKKNKIYLNKQGIWSLGMQAFFFFTGIHPVKKLDNIESVKDFVKDQALIDKIVDRNISNESVKQLIKACLKIDPSEWIDIEPLIELIDDLEFDISYRYRTRESFNHVNEERKERW